MRFLWIEDCDGGNPTQMSNIKKWKEYFGIEKEKRLTTLEDTLEFLEIKGNWKKFDAVLIDIRFPICKSDNTDEFCVFKKYFDNIITKEKFYEYAQSVEGNKQNASSGILLYLALVFRYNLPQSKIAFISANIDVTGVGLSSLRTMKEYIYKAKAHETLSDDEISEFVVANENLFNLYCGDSDKSEEDFNFETTDEIKWDSEETEYFMGLICKLTEIERELTQKFENKEQGLKYNSVKEEFKKIGLVIPQGFEKPGQESDGSFIKKSWYFDDWKNSINDDYSIIRTNIIVMCSTILDMLGKEGEEERIDKIITPYKKLIEKDNSLVEDCICNIRYYLNSIMECLPITYWANSNRALLQMYKKLVHEIISIFDNINIPENKISIIDYARSKVLKICRNWIVHQCISDINSKDIVFIFLLVMSLLFDINEMDYSLKQFYFKSEEDLITTLGNMEVFEFSRNVEKLKREKEIYIRKLKEIVDNSNGSANKKGLKKPRDNEPIMGVISGIGSEYSLDRKKVSMADLEKCFLICLNESNCYDTIKYKTEREEYIMRKIQDWCFSLFNN